MSTLTVGRPPEDDRTPAELARELAQMACAPAATFGGLLDDNDTERDRQYQRLLTRLIADWPDMWSRAKEDDVDERLRVSLSTNEDRELFNQHVDQLSTRGTVREEAAYLVGVEVGQQRGGHGETGGSATRPVSRTSTADSPSAPGRTVGERISELAGRAMQPHFEDIIERHSGLYSTLCDAVAPDQDQTTTTAFCERCQSAFFRVDEERNTELVERERLWFKIGIEVGRLRTAEQK